MPSVSEALCPIFAPFGTHPPLASLAAPFAGEGGGILAHLARDPGLGRPQSAGNGGGAVSPKAKKRCRNAVARGLLQRARGGPPQSATCGSGFSRDTFRE